MSKPNSREQELNNRVRQHAPEDEFKSRPFSKKLTDAKIKKLAQATLAFSEYLCDTTLYPYQREFALRVIQSMLSEDTAEVTALFSRQSGKTEAVAVSIAGMIICFPIYAQYIKDPRIEKFKKGVWVGIFAPAHEQADTLNDRLLSKLHTEHAKAVLADDEINLQLDDRFTRTTYIPNGSLVRTHSAAKQAKIESKTYHLVAIDEAQDVDPYVYRKSISPMLASTAGTQVKTGTPNMIKSDFYDSCQRNTKHDSLNLKDRRHFQYDYETVSKYNPKYKKYVQTEINRFGFDSDEVRMAYRLHWILERGMLVEATMFEAMGKDYFVVNHDPMNKVVAGIDIGKITARTIVTIVQPDYEKGMKMSDDDYRSHKRVLNWLELQGDRYDEQFPQIIDFLKNYKKLFRIHIDATGVGQHMYDNLLGYFDEEIQLGKIEVIGFEASTQTNSDGYSRLLLDLQNLRIEYPNSEKARKLQKQRQFFAEMTNVRKNFRGANLTVEESEDLPFKDYVSSLMLACMACDVMTEGAEMMTSDYNPFSRNDYNDRGMFSRGRSELFGQANERPFWRN